MQTSRGSLIVFEGLDRAGKSTLATKLVERLNKQVSIGHSGDDKTSGVTEADVCSGETYPPVACYYRFPDRTTHIGKMIDSHLKNEVKLNDHSIHLLFTANRWESFAHFKQLIQRGKTLVVDRYSYSGAAYSAAKEDMDLRWCYNTEIGLLKPDLLIYLTLSADEQKKRQGFGDELYEVTKFQNCVRESYQKIFQSAQESAMNNNDTFNLLNVVADGKTPDDLLDEIIEPVRQCIQNSANLPLKYIT